MSPPLGLRKFLFLSEICEKAHTECICRALKKRKVNAFKRKFNVKKQQTE